MRGSVLCHVGNLYGLSADAMMYVAAPCFFFVGRSLELGRDVSDDDVVVDDCISFETWNTGCGAWGSAVGICMLCHTGECIQSNEGSSVVSQHWRS